MVKENTVTILMERENKILKKYIFQPKSWEEQKYFKKAVQIENK